MRIGIIGGGPGGSRIAWQLAQKGFEVFLFESRPGWEKPCGGGLTPRVFSDFPDIARLQIQMNEIRQLHLYSEKNQHVVQKLEQPIKIVSRDEFNSALIHQARQVGAQVCFEPVKAINKKDAKWLVAHGDQQLTVDILIIADGACGRFSRMFHQVKSNQSHIHSFVAYLSGAFCDTITIRFLDNCHGYIWEFPRHNHISIGIGYNPDDMSHRTALERLHHWILWRHNADLSRSDFRGFRIPSIHKSDWYRIKWHGDNWALVGDSGFLCDAATGEGIYYALRSAEILAECIITNSFCSYSEKLRMTIGSEIYKSMQLRDILYSVGMVDFLIRALQSSDKLQNMVSRLLNGQTNYGTIKNQLRKQAVELLWDLKYIIPFFPQSFSMIVKKLRH